MKRLIPLLPLLLGACVTVSPATEVPVRPFRAIPLIPEEWYQVAYEEMEACLDKKGDYGALHFFIVYDGRMGTYGGMWSWRNSIFIAEGYEMNGPLLKHEFGHHIEQGLHPAINAKLQKCGVLTLTPESP